MFKPTAARTSRLYWSRWQGSCSVQHRLARLAALASLACVAIMLSSTAASAVLPRQECLSISDYSGIGDGTTDNTTPLNTAIAALPSYGGCIAFPAGKYKFNSALSYTPSPTIYSLTLIGAGANNTTLYWPGTNGITFNAHGYDQSIHVRDLTFSTGDTTGSYIGLTLTNSTADGINFLSDIVRTSFRGDDNGPQPSGTKYWGIGVETIGHSNINFDSDDFFGPTTPAGSGIYLSGNPSGTGNKYGVVYNIAKCGFWFTGNGIIIGDFVQGVSITQSNFTNGTTGIWLKPQVVTSTFAELAITGGNQFNTKGYQILLQQPVNQLIMNGNLIYVANGLAGIYFDSPSSLPPGIQNTIVNNAIGAVPPHNSNTTGILVGGANSPVVVTGNVFQYLTTGVDLTGTSGWNVQANRYDSVTTHVANIGSPGANSVGVATD
jgi:hypothetical protein